MTDYARHDHRDRSGFTAGMMLGLIAGAAVGYFLTTDKGKELLQNLADNTKGAIENIRENEVVKEKIAQTQDVLDQARVAVNEGASVIAEATEAPPAKKARFFQRSGSSLK